ncbi:hypothetical protein GIB67_000973 [Kingdonia uniflora]|uniref:Microtubule-associated protein 70-5 n=1 Tax=Kingdonia uniflora TaxID=39325 RepID=A0A7J7MG22_9MAGN|nr:hypothetical protein GIB67_000973 [Kingdonia uniflora]
MGSDSFEEVSTGGEGRTPLLSPSDPYVLELNRLHNQLKEKNSELGVTHAEIKALRVTEVLEDKAVKELSIELEKLDDKLRASENELDQKNLEINKLAVEKKEALSAQFAAEATLRRVHANQKDEDSVPIEAVIAPLEAEIKIYKNEIAALQEDNKALERLTKSKEFALLEAEKILRSALERALIVEEEETRIIDKINRQKVLEVEKLTQTIQELEESILERGKDVNNLRDYQRQFSELNEEKRILERELARTKVSANRVAAVVANEWKDENEKVMSVNKWLKEREFFQAEIKRLKEKLSISERTAKAEAQLKDKLKLRLTALEEGLKHVSSFSGSPKASNESQQMEKPNQILGFLNNAGVRKRSTSQPRASICTSKSSPLRQPNMGSETVNNVGEMKRLSSLKMKYAVGDNMLRKSLWASRSKVVDSDGKENETTKVNSELEPAVLGETKTKDVQYTERQKEGGDDVISGFLYDRLQREVINLRKCCDEKDGTVNAKEEEIQLLRRTVGALTKAKDIESKKLKRETAAREKDIIVLGKLEDSKQKRKSTNFSKR